MSYKENLQSNNSDLQTLINTVKNMSGGSSLTQTTFSFANSNNLDNKSKINDNNIDLQGLILMANINIKLNKNFTTQLNKLQTEYGEEFARINGLSDDQDW